MAILTVNGAAMPSPSEMRVDLFDVSSAADRNASGYAVIDRVGVKRKLELKWARLRREELSALLSAVGSDAFFTAAYPDPLTGGIREMTCYCGDRGIGVLRVEGGEPLWTQITMNWIER